MLLTCRRHFGNVLYLSSVRRKTLLYAILVETIGCCRIETPAITYTGPACVFFWYYMYGADIAQLMLYTENSGESAPWHTWSGNQGQEWFNASVTVPLTNNDDKVRLYIYYCTYRTVYLLFTLHRSTIQAHL